MSEEKKWGGVPVFECEILEWEFVKWPYAIERETRPGVVPDVHEVTEFTSRRKPKQVTE